MSRYVALLALVAVCVVNTHAAETEQPYVYNTVTAVAHLPEFATTIKIFVETPACAVDNKIFLQDFLTCDFSWVEDLAEKAPEVSPPTCPRTCALQWEKISTACYRAFRNRMEASKLLGEYAQTFFSRCDVHAKVTVDAGEESTANPATTAGSADKPASSNKPTGTVSATDIGGAPATTTAGPAAVNTPSSATSTAGPAAVNTPSSATPTAGGTPANPNDEDVKTPAAGITPVTTSGPVAEMPDNVAAEAGAEAPSAADAPSAGPATAPLAAPAPAPASAPIAAPEAEMAPEATSLPTSGATAASAKYAVVALLGMAMMMCVKPELVFMGRVHAAVGAAKALIAAVGTEALAHGGRNAMRGLGDIRLLVAQGAASRPLGISWVRGFAGDSMETQQRVQQGRRQGSRPAFAGLGTLHSSAQHLEGEEHAAPLAPCEKQPEQQPANELDQRLAESGHEDGAAAVLALVEGEGGRFTERNVLSAIQAVAEASNRQGASGSDIVRSPGFQTLVDMMLAGLMRFEPGLLAQAVRSCGELGASEEMLLDEIGRHLMKFVDQLTAADVAALVHGYALLDHSPSVVLFDALAARAAEVADDFTAEQRAQLVSGYERLAYAPKVPAALT